MKFNFQMDFKSPNKQLKCIDFFAYLFSMFQNLGAGIAMMIFCLHSALSQQAELTPAMIVAPRRRVSVSALNFADYQALSFFIAYMYLYVVYIDS